MAGALLAFTLSFDDFVITFFVAGVGSSTLPLKIYSMIRFGVSPTINALSTVVLISTMVLILGGSRFLVRREDA
jgi:spermidine/putrescine transport system permease protein